MTVVSISVMIGVICSIIGLFIASFIIPYKSATPFRRFFNENYTTNNFIIGMKLGLIIPIYIGCIFQIVLYKANHDNINFLFNYEPENIETIKYEKIDKNNYVIFTFHKNEIRYKGFISFQDKKDFDKLKFNFYLKSENGSLIWSEFHSSDKILFDKIIKNFKLENDIQSWR